MSRHSTRNRSLDAQNQELRRQVKQMEQNHRAKLQLQAEQYQAKILFLEEQAQFKEKVVEGKNFEIRVLQDSLRYETEDRAKYEGLLAEDIEALKRRRDELLVLSQQKHREAEQHERYSAYADTRFALARSILIEIMGQLTLHTRPYDRSLRFWDRVEASVVEGRDKGATAAHIRSRIEEFLKDWGHGK